MPSLPVFPKAALLIVDDDPAILRSLEADLSPRDFEIVVTDSPNTALEILELQSVGVVLSDYDMPHLNGLNFLNKVRQRWPNIQRLLMAAPDEMPTMSGTGVANRFVYKPWDASGLRSTVNDAFHVFELLRENAELWQLSQRQFRDLQTLNHSLEGKIAERTQQLMSAKLIWERTFDAIVDPVAIVRDDFSVVRANLAYADHANRSVSLVPGQKCYTLVAERDSPCENCPMTIQSSPVVSRGVDIQAAGQKTLHVWSFPMESATSSKDGNGNHVCYYRDVTEERVLEQKLSQSEKLASLGLFVGGVAHEINGPLGNIVGLTSLLQDEIQTDDENLEIIHDIEASAERCRRIIDSLRSFVHDSAQLRQQHIQVDELVEEVVRLFCRDYEGNAVVECEVDTDIPTIRGDVALLHQLFRNLLQNAYHSLPEKGGKVAVSVREGAYHNETAPNNILIVIEDNGSGIKEEDLKHVFEPFFTTKAKNKMGSGLGLSICHQIILKHRGRVFVESKLQEGTKFIIELPVGEATGSFRLAELEKV